MAAGVEHKLGLERVSHLGLAVSDREGQRERQEKHGEWREARRMN